jgi:hypothetical protein
LVLDFLSAFSVEKCLSGHELVLLLVGVEKCAHMLR